MKGMKVIVIGVFTCALAAMLIRNYFSLEKIHVFLGLVGLATVLYLVNAVLKHYFIRRRTLDFVSSKEVVPGTQKGELTAGLGIVPYWVSVIGLLAIAALATAVLFWVRASPK